MKSNKIYVLFNVTALLVGLFFFLCLIFAHFELEIGVCIAFIAEMLLVIIWFVLFIMNIARLLNRIKIMEAMKLFRPKFYGFMAKSYLRLSSRFITKATLLEHKASVYVEKQKEILNKQN